MEDDDEFEVIRLKKLLEDNLLKVEKENLELIHSRSFDPTLYSKDVEVFKRKQESPSKRKQESPSTSGATVNAGVYPRSANLPKKPIHSVVKDVKTCPHVKEINSLQYYDPENIKGNHHSHIHFINDFQSSLLSTNVKRRILLNDSRNKYIPCAVPLSPPVRIKREENIPTVDQSQPHKNHIYENHASETREAQNHPSETHVTENKSSSNSAPWNHSAKYFESQVFPKKKLVIQDLYSITIAGEKESISSCFNKLPTESSPCIAVGKKESTSSPRLRREIAEKSKPYPSSSSLPVTKDFPRNVSDGLSKVKFGSGKDFPGFKSFDSSFLSDKSNASTSSSYKRLNISSTEEQVPTSSQAEDLSQVKEESHGLNFHISLDSCSTKDVISKILKKIPDFLNQTEPPAHDTDACKSSSREQVKSDNEHQQIFESKSISHIAKSYQDIEKQIHTVSSFVQTDPAVEESVNKSELHNIVKEIVLDTMKSIPYLGYNSNRIVTSCQKVDSGIQSEVENEVADFEKNVHVQFPSKGALLDAGNATTCQQNSSVSKSIQVSLNPIHDIKEKENLSKSYNKENSDSSDTSEENHLQSIAKKLKEEDAISERSAHRPETPKIESMLEKIYQHVCQENKASNNFIDSSINNPILTRDVAVQFNPLHTCTKSTITLEIKTTDTSSQYDIPQGTDSNQASTVDVSVQTTELRNDLNNRQAHAFTQCEQKIFSNSVAQTELLFTGEYSATNTSVSSTPVSDNMFMDDLLSEGEISLPWNLRLLSFSDKSDYLNKNTADSSDVSIKDKDYSLSEGEIHPNIMHYLNVPQSDHAEDDDSHLDVYPSKLSSDSKIQGNSKSDLEKHSGRCLAYNRNLRLHISTSSPSEGELNSSPSLSLGEVSPGFRNSCMETHVKLGGCPSNSSPQDCDKMCCDLNSTYVPGSDISHPSMINLNVAGNEEDKKNFNVETDLQNLPHVILQTVDEETHAMFD